MVAPVTTKKITITLPEELLESARELTSNISGYAAEALTRKIKRDLLAEDLRRYEEEHGAFTEEEMAQAHARLYAADAARDKDAA